MQKTLICIAVLIVTLMLSPIVSAEQMGTAYFDLGIFSYEEQDYQNALQHFKKAMEKNPENPVFHHYLGKTYLKLAQYKEAAHHLNIAWEKDPGLPEAAYDLGMANMQMGNFSRATIMFAETLTKEPDHVLARYQMGIAAYKQKQFKKANAHFIKASRANPSIKPNSFYYSGICHLQMGDPSGAIEKLSWVLNNTESNELKENAEKWLEIAKKQKKTERPYSLYAKIGFQYDTNVPLEPLDEGVYDNKDDAGLEFSFSGKYHFYRKNDFTLGVGYDHYQTIHYELSEYNIVGLTPSLYAMYNYNPFAFSLSYIPTYYFLDNEGYMLQHQIKPETIWEIRTNLFTRLSFSYYDNTHYINENRDGQTLEVKGDVYYSLNKNKVILYAGLGYAKNSASHTDYEYGEIKPFTGAIYKAPFELELAASIDFYLRTYDEEDTTFAEKRDETEYDAVISVTRGIKWDWLSMALEYKYSNNDSNIDEYEYTRNMVTLYCIATY